MMRDVDDAAMPMIEPLRLSVDVGCSAEHAFDVWTSGIATWWPTGHTVSADPDVVVVLERHLGGRIYERTSAGAEHEWGEVTLWEPPRRLGYLWHLRRDRADGTDVEIRFVERTNGSSVVEIEHRGWERLGDSGVDWRERNDAGWQGLISHYLQALEGS